MADPLSNGRANGPGRGARPSGPRRFAVLTAEVSLGVSLQVSPLDWRARLTATGPAGPWRGRGMSATPRGGCSNTHPYVWLGLALAVGGGGLMIASQLQHDRAEIDVAP